MRLIGETRVVPAHQRSRLNGWLQQAMALRDAWHVEAAVLLFAIVMVAWLWRIGQLDLLLTPTHPDYAGGLGAFGVAQTALLPITFSYTGILAGTFAEEGLSPPAPWCSACRCCDSRPG